MAKEIFVGRRVAQRDFREALTIMIVEPKDSKVFKALKRQRDETVPTPQLFLILGEAGLGKSSTLSQYVSIAHSVASEMKKDIIVVNLDFSDFLFAKNALPFTPRTLVHYLHKVFTDKNLGVENHFSEYDYVKRRVDHVREKVALFKTGQWRAGAADKPMHASTVQSVDATAVLVPQARNEAETALLAKLREEKKLPDDDLDLFENAEYRLAKALLNGLAALSAATPVVVVIDNLERLGSPETEQWLRTVVLSKLFEKKYRVMTLIATSDNLLRRYRNSFPEEALYAISLADETLTKNDVEELCQGMRVNLEPQTSERVEAATGGVPIVVRDMLSIAKEGRPTNDILDSLERVTLVRDKISVMVNYFLTTSADKALLAHILHLALLNECDNRVIASLWNCAFADVGTELAELSDHYPFFLGRTMHDAVRYHIRDYCMRQPSGDVGDILTDFAAHTISLFAEDLKQLTTAVPAIDKRYKDERYEHAFLGYVSSLLWQRRDEVKRIMPGCFCECLLYNQVLAGRILGTIADFGAVLPPDHLAFYSNLTSGLRAVAGVTMWEEGKPPAEELSMLEMLEAAGALLSAPQKALLHLKRANVVYRLAEYENAFEDLEKCEPFAEESDFFAETLADGYQCVGDAFFGALRFDSAIKAYGRVAEIRPGRFDAWYGLGRSYAALTKHTEAEDAFIKAAGLEADRWDLYGALGDEQFACEKFAEAAASYERAADLFDGNRDIWQGLGRSCAALARHAEAVKAFARAVDIQPDDPQLWYEMGYSQAQQGLSSDAIDSLVKALSLRSDYWEAAALLGDQYALQGSFAEAVKAFLRAAASRPQDATILNSLGKAAFAAGDDAQAIEAFTKATESMPDFAEAHNNLGMAYMHSDRLDEAAASYEKAIANQPDFAEALNNLGTTFTMRNRHADALEAYTKAVRAKPGLGDAWYNVGLSLHALGKYAEALEPYEKATSLAPANHGAWFNRGIALSALGKNGEAIDCFAKAVELQPQSYDGWYKMGRACADENRSEEAVRAFSRAAELKADSEEAWHDLGCALALLEKHDEAVAAFAKAVAIIPGQYDAWYSMGKSHQECGRYKEALEAYREALKAESRAEAWHNGGKCSYYLNNYEEAVELLSQAKALTPDNKETLYTLGLSQHALGNFDEAVKLYRRTLELSPDMANARMNLALSLHASGAYSEAVETYGKITESQPQNGEAWYNLGRACEALGKTEEALGAYEKTVGLDPEKAGAWYSMGQIQVSLERYAEAIQSFTKVVQKTPDAADAWSSLALASYYTGRFQESIDAYTKTLELTPGDAAAWGSLGLTYYTMGNYGKAVEASEKAVSLAPGELWIQVNLALAAVLARQMDKATTAFDAVMSLAQTPGDLLHPIASLKEMVARDSTLASAREILTKLEEAWRALKQ